jgi:phosphorylcholine metabolism protein LicD
MIDKNTLANELKNIDYKEGYASTLSQNKLEEIELINSKYVAKYKNPSKGDYISFGIEQVYPGGKRIFSTDMIFPLKFCKFEDAEFYIPNKIEQYLEFYYGCYMEFPKHIDLSQHAFMFSEKDYTEINQLYKSLEKEVLCQ